MEPTVKGSAEPGMLIDCNECAMQGTDACDGCVVSFILDRSEGAVVFDAAAERAVRAMTQAGLVPLLRWEQKTG
jgi:hypothetical protein